MKTLGAVFQKSLLAPSSAPLCIVNPFPIDLSIPGIRLATLTEFSLVVGPRPLIATMDSTCPRRGPAETGSNLRHNCNWFFSPFFITP